MSSILISRMRRTAFGALVCAALPLSVAAQTPPANSGATQADRAIAQRKAVYTLIGGNFNPIGNVLQGKAQFDGAEALKRAERVAFLAGLSLEVYPDVSKTGNTKAKPEIWGNRATFDKKSQDFVEHANALVAVLRKDRTDVAAFKTAATAVAGDCKGCHDDFRVK